MPVPNWDINGVIPPINSPTGGDRSPYSATFKEFVMRFGTSLRRIQILRGFLAYRDGLRATGISGVQWVNGSFLEHIEITESRDPNDVDVVTFFHLPPNTNQTALFNAHPILQLSAPALKSQYKVDGYLTHLGTPAERLLKQSAYWYSMWSHRRNRMWKGFVEIELSAHEDPTIPATLNTLEANI